MSSGAIFDYCSSKVIAENLEAHMRKLLDKAEDAVITWEDYCHHVFLKGIPLKLWLKHIGLKEDTLNLNYVHKTWAEVKAKAVASMAILQSDRYFKNSGRHYNLEIFAFDPKEARMESYILGYYGLQRTYEKEPRPETITEEQRKEFAAWKSYLPHETVAELLARPGVSWFGRLRGRYMTSSLEPVKIVL